MRPDLERIFAGLPVQILVLAPDGPRFTILAASDAYMRATLTERADIIGKGVFEVFPDNPDDPETKAGDVARTSFQRVVDERRPDAMGIRRHDVRRPEAEGGGFSERYWQPLNSPILGEDGQVVCIIHQVEDVTETVLHGNESDALRAANVALREADGVLRREMVKSERARQELERSQLLLRSSLEAHRDTIVFSIDRDYRYLYFNKTQAEVMKRAYGDDIELGGRVLDYITDAEDRAAAKDNYDRALAGESHTNVRVYGEVERAYYESFFSPVHDESGAIIGATGLARDITARRRAEEQLAQMTRLYATLSQVNQTIVRAKEPEELYRSICDVAVEFGQFTLAWVGLLDAESGEVRPVAANGVDVAQWPFETVNIHQGLSRNGLVATAIRSHQTAITGDVQSDERMRSVLGQVEGRDYHAVAAIPFGLRGNTVGALVLVSQRSGLFREASEVGLLEEMGMDVSFALEAMASEAERKRAEEQLAAQVARLKVLADASAAFAAAQDYQTVLDTIVRQTCEQLADGCFLGLLSDDAEWLEFAAVHTLDPAQSAALHDLVGLPTQRAGAVPTITEVLRSGRPSFVPVLDPEYVRKNGVPEYLDLFEAYPMHSVIIVPLLAHGTAVGVLNLHRYRGDQPPFTEEDLSLAQDLADRAALAISNARLLTQMESELADREAAEAALRESEAMRTAAERVAQVGSYRWEVDLTSPRTSWSEGMFALFDVDPEQFDGDPTPILNSRVHPDDRSRVWRIAESIAESGEATPVEFRVVHRDGSERILHSEFSVERDGAGKAQAITGYYQDVTDQRRSESEIHRLNAELEERVASRTTQLEAANRELESFAYSISHDLRAPLRAIDGFSAMLAEDAGDRLTPDEAGHLQRVRSGAQRMAVLIDELLELSRAGRKEMHAEDVDLSAVASSVVKDLREAQPERQVEVTITPGMHALADAALVRAILANLVGNAWKFTGTREAAHIEVGVVDLGGPSTFFVRDDGVGFDAAKAMGLFGAFQRFHTADQFAGDGIGLATVRRLVARHGGRVWAESEVETGATFYFTLSESAASA